MKTLSLRILGAMVALACLAPSLWAKEELVTLPNRDTVQLTIYNSVDLTLVRETRSLSFKKGSNRIQFSWANTLIDPTSVEFRAVTSPEKLEILDTSYPPESREMLIWNIQAEDALSATCEITYFTSGITWAAEYHGMLANDEASMTLTGYVTVLNRSGEEYEDATVRLVVGSINLVEQIAGLARGQREDTEQYKRARDEMKGAATRDWDHNKEIVKEGLSEYYIYTVGGKETVPNGWSKRLESFKQDGVPVSTVYTLDAEKYGFAMTKLLTFKNSTEFKLGREPLPEGIVRLYRVVGANELSFVGAIATKYIAKNDEIKVNAGPDPEVTLKLTRTSMKKTSLTFERNGGWQWVAGWDVVEEFKLEVKNFRKLPGNFEINLSFNGDFDFESGAASTKIDFRTYRFSFKLDANSNNTITYKLTTRNGTNVKNR
ncbi:MAG: hypothetical protein IT462_08345 [Planctomycetes bacterium]|nr:hypothetical protein [Planctomycetota bacterium]